MGQLVKVEKIGAGQRAERSGNVSKRGRALA